MTNWIDYGLPDGYTVTDTGWRQPVFKRVVHVHRKFTRTNGTKATKRDLYIIKVRLVWDSWRASLYQYGKPIAELDGFDTAVAAAVAMELHLSEVIEQ